MNTADIETLKLELSLKAKNGLNFIIAASMVWLLISYVWTLPYSAYDKSIMTFIVGAIMLPLAWLLSKFMKTEWTVKGNPLQPLGLWLNFAQLFYFPFLILMLIKSPDYFVMTYVIITGAHFFPYAWYYDEKAYAIMAGVISFGALAIGLSVTAERMFIVPLFMGIALVILSVLLFLSYQRKRKLSMQPSPGEII
ncbi:DUF7010 family protein [Catalinimonas niigatensis]|uniref:DUF7010 family protein n=1 Tax=Catalinimonas niigatensis TaxID=1397264 RepID=UPI002665D544|nr:hypothetical protein [Catalinimonas niigatensis]WPP52681.1 hypothetical protein PZB72_09845 [Catalinimonas niigatensis]